MITGTEVLEPKGMERKCMMIKILGSILLPLTAFAAPVVRPEMLVSTEWLAQHLSDPTWSCCTYLATVLFMMPVTSLEHASWRSRIL